MLTRKIASQPNASVSDPPSRTPKAAPLAPTAAQAASARFRSRPSGKIAVIRERAAGESRAAPTPCGARAARSISCEPASPGGERGGAEKSEAGEEEAPPAEQVGSAPAEQEQPAEGERVGGHHPLQVGEGEAEVGLDRRQRHVHDRNVEHDHELRRAEERKRERRLKVVDFVTLLLRACATSVRLGERGRRGSSGPGLLAA
jgi:hypothetical protein